MNYLVLMVLIIDESSLEGLDTRLLSMPKCSRRVKSMLWEGEMLLGRGYAAASSSRSVGEGYLTSVDLLVCETKLVLPDYFFYIMRLSM